MRSARIPPVAGLALRLLVPPALRDVVLGDLEEELVEMERAGASRARRSARAWNEVGRTVAARVRSAVPVLSPRSRPAGRRGADRREDTRLAAWRRDFADAARAARRAPLATALAAGVLALGLGGTAAVWSVLESMVRGQLRYEDSDRLVGLWAEGDWSLEEFDFARERLRSIETLAAVESFQEVNLHTATGARLLPGAHVSCDYFSLLRTLAVVGRSPVTADCAAGAPPVVVLSYDAWQTHFGGDREVVGQTQRLDSQPVTVIGVMGPGFVDPAGRFALWLPMRSDPADPTGDYRNNHSYTLFGRLSAGADLAAAQADVESLARDLGESFQYPPDYDKSKEAVVVALREQLTGRLAPPLRALLIAAACVLGIACANVANLLLVRSLRRQGEILVRTALGASRLHLVRRLLAESTLLVVLAAGAGLLFARGALAAVPWLLPAGTPRLDEVRLTPSALVLTAALASATALLLAAAPALRTRLSAGGSLRHGADRGESRLRGGFVVAQTALAVVLLVGALAAVRHFDRLLEVDTGFDPGDLTLVRLEIPADLAAEERQGLLERLENRLAALPGVVAVGAVQRPPLTEGWVMPLEQEDHPRQRDDVAPTAFWRAVSPSYFSAADLALVRGRLLGSGDDAGASPVALVNEELARRFFGDEDPLGRGVRVPLHEHYSTIVGIVRDERLLGPGAEAPAILYQPYAQAPTRTLAFVIETAESSGTATAQIAPGVRRAVAEVDPRVPLAEIEPLDALLARRLQPLRSLAVLLAALAALGVALGAIGLFGVLSQTVLARTREIGLRIAIGADARQVARMIVRQSLVLTSLGLVFGFGISLALVRAVGTRLDDFRPSGSVVAIAVALLGVATLAASFLPALRATRIEPTRALRSE